MSNCGNCRSQICTCRFQGDEATTAVVGNGTVYAPFQGRPLTPLYRPVGAATRVATQAISVNTDTAIIFQDTDLHVSEATDMWKPAAPTRLTAPFDGIYFIGGHAEEDTAPAAHFWHVWIAKNGAVGTPLVRRTVSVGVNNFSTHASVIGLVRLAATDYIELYVRTNSASTVGILSSPTFWAQYMGA